MAHIMARMGIARGVCRHGVTSVGVLCPNGRHRMTRMGIGLRGSRCFMSRVRICVRSVHPVAGVRICYRRSGHCVPRMWVRGGHDVARVRVRRRRGRHCVARMRVGGGHHMSRVRIGRRTVHRMTWMRVRFGLGRVMRLVLGKRRRRRAGQDECQETLHAASPSSGRTVMTRIIPACMW